MAALRYHLLDVFTDDAFRGNPLAVFVDPPELATEQMQRIANELNLSETVFTWTPATPGDGWRTRIFTASVEMPFAGHPTIGTACLISHLGLIGPDGVVLDEPVGAVAVEVAPERRADEPDAWLTVPAPATPLPALDRVAAAEVLRLDESHLHPSLPVEAWTSGVPFAFVPVADLDALGRSAFDGAAWERRVPAGTTLFLYVVTPVDPDAGANGVPERWRARMFAPGLGITEDPATGAAAAAFSGYLLRRLGDGDIEGRVRIDQGVEMGRASTLIVHLVRRGASDAVVRIGGRSVVIGEGTLYAPPAAG